MSVSLCSVCASPITEENKVGQCRNICRACYNARARPRALAYYYAHREERIHYQSEYSRKHPQKYDPTKPHHPSRNHNEIMREYYQRNKEDLNEKTRLRSIKPEIREKRRQQTRLRNTRIKILVVSHYSPGMKCQNPDCAVPAGMKDLRALTIDHINGGGTKHHEELRELGIDFYRWILKNNFPEGLQVLCMNCNFIKRIVKGEHGVRAKPSISMPAEKQTQEIAPLVS